MSPSSSPSFELPDLGLLSFIPPRPLNTAQTTSISLDNLLDPPLVLHEDVRDGCGGRLWEAGIALAKFLIRNDRLISGGGDFIDLGSGSGLVGLAVAHHLARQGQSQGQPGSPEPVPSAAPAQTHILLTDLSVLLPLMEKNIALNPLSIAKNRSTKTSIEAAILDWSAPLPEPVTQLSGPNTETGSRKRPLTILAADCVYYEPAFPDLLDTLERLLGKDGGGDEDRERKCWFCVKRRRKADKRFIGALGRRFWIKEWSLGLDKGVGEGDRTGQGEKGVRLWEVRRKGWIDK